jgi:hypothetical protein
MYSNTNYQDELIDLYIKEYFKIPLDKVKILKDSENENNNKDDENIEMADEEKKIKKKIL